MRFWDLSRLSLAKSGSYVMVTGNWRPASCRGSCRLSVMIDSSSRPKRCRVTISRRQLQDLLHRQKIGCTGLVKSATRHTSVKTRIVAHQQQVVRIDRETRDSLDSALTSQLLTGLKPMLSVTEYLSPYQKPNNPAKSDPMAMQVM